MNKNCKVILLPTKDLNGLWSYKGKRLHYDQANFNDEDETEYFHLNIFSDEALKQDEYGLFDGGLGRIGIDTYNAFVKYSVTPKKLIATTDKELQKEGVALIDDEFIKEYCNNPVEEVLVEYYNVKTYELDANSREMDSYYSTIKLSSSGSIIIKPAEENWNAVVDKYQTESNRSTFMGSSLVSWLKQNYEVPKKK